MLQKNKLKACQAMEQFLVIAAVHFLALLSPGPDFFLIARTSISSGWRVASGACLGIAVANGLFIAAAFAGTAALRHGSALFLCLQLAGCAYLLYLGVLFIRFAGASHLEPSAATPIGPAHAGKQIRAWWRAFGIGFLSGVLNPKNALFYASLAAMLTGPGASAAWKAAYGVWMFGVVLLWDGLVAVMIGNQAVLRRSARAVPWLERISGCLLILLVMGILAMLWRD